jgi:KDO2-lipid IV(A) lauroyltransferase
MLEAKRKDPACYNPSVLRDVHYGIRSAILRAFTASIILLLRILPARGGYAVARGLARIFPFVQPRHVRNARRQVQIVFGEDVPKTRVNEIVGESLEHLAYTVVEFVRMGRSDSDYVKAMCVEERGGIEKLRGYLERGKGVIALGLHLGNWEWSGAYIAVSGLPIYAVGKPQRDEYFSNLAFPWRERHGIVNIAKATGKLDTKIVRALKTNGVLGLISDQNGGRDGVFAPLFGIEASTIAGPAALHLKFRSPLVPIVAWRRSPGKLVFEVMDEIDTSDILADLDSTSPRFTDAERMRAVLARVNAAYERIIREHPEQWLWIHKRFKSRPAGGSDPYA